jgi:DNA topoisomerase VI subunit B
MTKLKRTTFETSRAAEYFDARELQAQTGQPLQNFATVALKELVDNALDACETAGVAPDIRIDVRDELGTIRLTVSDNGPGILPETVRKVLDFDVRVSDKAAYRSPTRGAQGNALKTVVGIPHALGSIEPTVVEARGVRHEIRAWVDPADELRVNHDRARADTGPGTRVTLALSPAEQNFAPGFWSRAFALLNPHATVRFSRSADDLYRANYQKVTATTSKSRKLTNPPPPSRMDGVSSYLPTSLRRIGTRQGPCGDSSLVTSPTPTGAAAIYRSGSL